MHTPARTILPRLALALLFAAPPAALRAQDTAQAPASTAPRASLPTGTRVTRPTLRAPATVARQPSGAPAATQQPTQQQATVPDVSGRTVDEARRLLARSGLAMGSVAEGQGDGTPGTIVQQQPQAGSVVAPKSAVRVWVAPQPPLSRPPVTRPPATEPPAQQPPTTQQPPASRPPPQPLPVVTVPRLAGRTVDDARAVLARVNLQVGSVAEAAGSGAPGTIVRQSPRPGIPVVRGSAVQVWVVPARVAQQQPPAEPTTPLLVRVPNVVGQTVEGARETLAAAGLAPGAVAEGVGTGTPGTVARQQPAAGSAMLPNSRVGLWLVPARRPAPPAPVGQVATRPDPPAPVRPQPQPQPPAQRPAPARDTASTVPAPVAVDSAAVPDVRRLALPQAQDALAAAGFAVAFDTALADSAGWIVSAQQPSPGARLASGGVVAVLLDPPAAVAAAPTPAAQQPPLSSGLQETPVPPTAQQPGPRGRALWIALAALLLMVAAAAGARRMRARKQVLPFACVSARLRMDAPARLAVEGAPFGDARLRFRMNPGRTAVRVADAGPLFVSKEVTGD